MDTAEKYSSSLEILCEAFESIDCEVVAKVLEACNGDLESSAKKLNSVLELGGNDKDLPFSSLVTSLASESTKQTTPMAQNNISFKQNQIDQSERNIFPNVCEGFNHSRPPPPPPATPPFTTTTTVPAKMPTRTSSAPESVTINRMTVESDLKTTKATNGINNAPTKDTDSEQALWAHVYQLQKAAKFEKERQCGIVLRQQREQRKKEKILKQSRWIGARATAYTFFIMNFEFIFFLNFVPNEFHFFLNIFPHFVV